MSSLSTKAKPSPSQNIMNGSYESFYNELWQVLMMRADSMERGIGPWWVSVNSPPAHRKNCRHNKLVAITFFFSLPRFIAHFLRSPRTLEQVKKTLAGVWRFASLLRPFCWRNTTGRKTQSSLGWREEKNVPIKADAILMVMFCLALGFVYAHGVAVWMIETRKVSTVTNDAIMGDGVKFNYNLFIYR